MINKLYLLFVLTLNVLFSCTSYPVTESKYQTTCEIDLDRNDKVSVHDLFSAIEIIPLETNENSSLKFRLGEPDKFLMYEGCYYFLDRQLAHVVVFNAEGKFLKRINHQGGGQDEYYSIDDIIINRFNGTLEVLSSNGGYINVYSLPDAEFIERITFPANMPVVHNFHNLSKDVYVFLTEELERTILFYNKNDQQSQMSDYALPKWFSRSPFSGKPKNPFYVYNDTVCFKQIYDGDVFSVTADDYMLKPRYIWGFGEHKFHISALPEDRSMLTYIVLRPKIRRQFAIGFQVYAENSRYYFTRFKYKKVYKHLIYDKFRNEYLLFDKFVDAGHCAPLWIDEEAIYTFLSPAFLSKIIDPAYLSPENRTIYNQIKEDDNPIGVKYVFKLG